MRCLVSNSKIWTAATSPVANSRAPRPVAHEEGRVRGALPGMQCSRLDKDHLSCTFCSQSTSRLAFPLSLPSPPVGGRGFSALTLALLLAAALALSACGKKGDLEQRQGVQPVYPRKYPIR